MKKTRTIAPLNRIVTNDGQIPWLPKNPRSWTKSDLDRMVHSIEEDPDFLDDRPVMVVTDPATAPELADLLVAFGGNLRSEGAKQTSRTAVPVVIYQPETDEDRETIKRRAIKDNGTYGEWDTETLANEWDGDFTAWGVPDWIVGFDKPAHKPAASPSAAALTPSNDPGLQFLTIGFSAEEYEFVKQTLSDAGDNDREALLNLLGYNSGGDGDETDD